MSSKRNVDMSNTEVKEKIVEAPQEGQATETTSKKKVLKRIRGKKYQAVRSQVDKTKLYDPAAAIDLIKKLSYSSFDASIDAHLVLKDTGITATLSFPNSTGKSVKVAIVSDKLIKEIADGKIDFDVLVCSPEFMPKLAKHARVLGPKGLMPNPKNGTLTPKPELKKKDLEAGQINLKTEKKAPLISISVGKVSMDTKDLVENIEALLKAFNDKVAKLSISASMSPGVKVALLEDK